MLVIRIFFKIKIEVFDSLNDRLWRIPLENVKLLSVIKHCSLVRVLKNRNLSELLRYDLGISSWCDDHVVGLKSLQLSSRFMDDYVVWKVIDWLHMLYLSRQIITFVPCVKIT